MPTYVIWNLGPSKAEDERIAEFDELRKAIDELRRLRQKQRGASFEVRKDGERVDIEDGVPSARRSTSIRMTVVQSDELQDDERKGEMRR